MIGRRSRGASVPRPSTAIRPSAACLAAIAGAALIFFLVSPAQAENATGPEVGTKIPDIGTYDQHGKVRTFEDLRGSEGLLVLFYRTADW